MTSRPARRAVPVLALALLAGAAVLPPALAGRLRGEVRTADREPVGGATVLALREDAPPVLGLTSTGSNGFIRLNDLPSGRYTVTVRAEGLAPLELRGIQVGGPFRSVVDLRAEPGAPKPLEVHLPRGEGADMLDVDVMDEDGRPLRNVRVRARPVSHRANPATAETDPEGGTTLGPLTPGTWSLAVDRAGFTRLVVPRFEWPGGEVEIHVRMLPLAGDGAPALEDLLPPGELIAPSAPEVAPAEEPAVDAAEEAPAEAVTG